MKTKRFAAVFILCLAGCTYSDDSSRGVNGNPSAQIGDAADTNSGGNGDSADSGSNAAGFSEDNLEHIGRDFKSLMSTLGIPGAQLAITRNEKLVYLASLGQASTDQGPGVTENSLFRIASLSKPLTLLAISKLIAEKKLQPESRVFGPGSLLADDYGTPPYEIPEMAITVGHLLEHTGGFTNEPYDIMFDDIRLTHTQLIGKVLDERSLAYEPGTRYEYSNFGYCLLGRIIEKVTGMGYEDYVRQEILYPMDISDMRIAGNTRAEAFPNEVSYYSNWISPYLLNIRRMDSHGGWIASARDLAKFAVHVDTSGGVPDLLDAKNTLSYMQSGVWNHNGALPGTVSVLQVGYPFSYVVLVNKGETDFYEIINVIRNFMNDKIREQKAWPKRDLFEYY